MHLENLVIPFLLIFFFLIKTSQITSESSIIKIKADHRANNINSSTIGITNKNYKIKYEDKELIDSLIHGMIPDSDLTKKRYILKRGEIKCHKFYTTFCAIGCVINSNGDIINKSSIRNSIQGIAIPPVNHFVYRTGSLTNDDADFNIFIVLSKNNNFQIN